MQPDATPTPTPDLGMIAETLKAMHEQVRFADAKASFIAAPNVVLLGFMAAQADKLAAVGSGGRHVLFWVATGLVLVYAVVAAGSLTYVVLVVLPRHVSLGTNGRTHWGHVVARYGTDHVRYGRDLRAMTADDWAADLAGQVVEVCHIAHRKYGLIRHAAVWMAWSLACWVAAAIAVTLAR